MDEQSADRPEGISVEDWERTPISVKHLLVQLAQRVRHLEHEYQALEAQLQLLQEQVKRNSANSSQAPSSDSPQFKKRRHQSPSGRRRGAQAGHQGHERHLFAPEDCRGVSDHYPETCGYCGAALSGEDPQPYRHQTVEIPPITPVVYEYRLHQRVCERCGKPTRASLPMGVSSQMYGVRVEAMVGVLSGMYHHSQRLVQQALADLFGIQMSLGSVNNLRQQASEAVAPAVEAAKAYVRAQPIIGSDETSFPQGNSDGRNPDGRQGWLWVMVTPLVAVFEVFLSRSQAAAQALLGEAFGGILVSDRHSAYSWVEVERRQVCWAHLKRDFTKIAERSGVSQALGQALLEQEKQLFTLWYQVRDGTLTRQQLIEAVVPLRERVQQLLREGANYNIGAAEKTPLAKTVRTCHRLLQIEPALWLFVSVEGLEPTNNDSERALRPAVIWRRLSFGAQTEHGSQFVSRMLTVVTTLRSQSRNVLEYMTDACQRAREGKTAPSLLPKITQVQEQLTIAA
jgi:hypothetical protein